MPENHYYDYLVQQPLRTVAMLAASIAVYITYTFVSDYRRWIVFSKFLTLENDISCCWFCWATWHYCS